MRKTMLLIMLCLLAMRPIVSEKAVQAMKQGELLRMHVLAQDDTPAMQSLKLPVRNAVQAAYAELADPGCSMLDNAKRLLPALTQAAQRAASEADFGGEVAVMLGTATFDTRLLEGVAVPAGDYPALIVRMGAGLGHNWWGLIDPEASLLAACAEEGEGIQWDWSLHALWQAFRHSLGLREGGQVA